jgi:peptidyl-prolyl cis-trans isomerase C
VKIAERLAREPFVRFLALGAVLFAVDRALARGSVAPDPAQIVVSDAFVEGLRARHEARSGERASARDERALVDEFVREEALVREARAAGLAEGDVIVRRRLVQKVEFMLAAELQPAPPTDRELRAWMREHGAGATVRTRFEHRLFAREGRSAPEDDARAALAAVARGIEPSGDRFLRGNSIGPASDVRIDAAFGPGFASRIAALPIGEWSGPIDAALGVHLVRVIEREARPARLDEARARDAIDEARRAELLEREIARIVGRYRVVREAERAP